MATVDKPNASCRLSLDVDFPSCFSLILMTGLVASSVRQERHLTSEALIVSQYDFLTV
jgi:hypothetical protein